MKKSFILLVSTLFLCSCGSYRYYHPTTNQALFQNAGEIQVYGDGGSSGFSVKGAFSLPKNIGVMGMYNSSVHDYRVKEGEIGLGYYTPAEPLGIFVVGGLGFGNNFRYTDSTHTDKSWEGEFLRPFVQLNAGIDGGKIFGALKGDLIASLKGSYFIYDGLHLDGTFETIRSRYLLVEPAITMGLGTRVFRIDFSTGFPIHPTFEGLNRRRNARTFPVTVGIGLRFIFGRKKDLG